MKKNWEIKTLGDVCEIKSGSTPLRSNKLFWENGNFPWFTIDDIREQGRIITNTKQNVTELALSKLTIYPIDTILLCCTASVGEYAITKIPITSNQQFNGLTIKDSSLLIPEFLFYYSSTLKDLLLEKSGKTTIDFVSQAKVKEIPIPIPPIKEQEEIVERLDKGFELIDSLKETAKKNLDNAKELFQSVLREELSPKEGWETKTLGEVCEYIKEQGIYNNLPYIGMEDIESKTMRFTGSKEIKKVLSNTFRFTNDLILFGRLRPYLCKIYEPDFEGHCSTEIFPIKTTKYIDKSYLKYWLFQDSIIEKINDTCTGARMPRANMNTVLEFEITFPKEGQKDIVNRLDRIKGYCEELEGNYKRVLELCEELKQGLLREAFSY